MEAKLKVSFGFSMSLVVLCCLLLASLAAEALRVKDEQVILDSLSDYELCQKKDYSGDWCHQALLRWVESNPGDAFVAGKMTVSQMNAWGAVPFFKKAFGLNQGVCGDPDLKTALLAALNLPASRHQQIVESAKVLTFNHCFEEMKSGLLEQASLESPMFKNVCSEMNKKGHLSGLKKKKCEELK